MLCLAASDVRATGPIANIAAIALPTAPTYSRHAPERTLLYALVQAHYLDFTTRPAAKDRFLPDYVREEFDEFLRCGVLDQSFFGMAPRRGSRRWWSQIAEQAAIRQATVSRRCE